MARRCTTVPGFGLCCRAAQQGILNQPFVMPSGKHCGVCRTRQSQSRDPRKAGKTVFDFRFVGNGQCGITSGCPALGGNTTNVTRPGNRLALPSPQGF